MQKKNLKHRTLNTILYCYVEAENAKYAKTEGKRLFGGFSAYVNVLIANDRGVAGKLGNWKAKGENALKREKNKPRGSGKKRSGARSVRRTK